MVNHYHSSSPLGLGPQFWNNLVVSKFKSGTEFTKDEIIVQITESYQLIKGKSLAKDFVVDTARVFLGTYTKLDALGELIILQNIEKDRYRVNNYDFGFSPHWVVAYAILDFWKANFPERTTINLDVLTEGNGVANIFMIGAGKVANVLQKMQAEGFIDLYRVAPPYQVVLLRSDMDAILEKIYANE